MFDGFFGSIGLGSFGLTAAAAARQAAAAQKRAQQQAAAAAKQLAAAQSKSRQTAALQAREAGLAAKVATLNTALQAGTVTKATIKQATQAQKQATAAAKAAAKLGPGATMTPGTDVGNVPGAGMSPGGTNVPPYTIAPPTTTPGAGYLVGPGIHSPVARPFTPSPYPQTPFSPPMGGGYGGGGGMPPPMMPSGGGGYAGGGIPPTGGYSITPPNGGYAIGGPQGAPGAYVPTTEVYGSYSVGPQAPNVNMLSPTTPYSMSIGQTPYAGNYAVNTPGGGYGIGSLSQGGIVAYTTAQQGDSRACTNKRNALSKAYQRALKAIQKNPKSKAMDNFNKRYPKLVSALQKKCVTGLLPGPGVIGGYQQCQIGFQRNPLFRPGYPRGAQYGNAMCVAIGQQPYSYPQGFSPPPTYNPIPFGSGAQPGETVWQGGGSYSSGAYTIGVEGSPDSGGLIPAGGGGAIPDDDVQYSSAVIGPVSGRDSDSIPIQGDDGVTDQLDASVLAMAESGDSRFDGLGKHHHHHGGRGFIMPVDYGTDASTILILDNRDCSTEDETCNPIGLSGLSRVGRRKGYKERRKTTLPMLAMR